MILHPGPMNRGVEIASEVADGPYSVILDQVTNGVAVRMAVLYLLLGGGGRRRRERPPAAQGRTCRRSVPAAIDDDVDVLLEDGRVAEVGARIKPRGAEVVDVARPRRLSRASSTSTSTCASRAARTRRRSRRGTRAAAAGGFTAVCAMPNTEPVNDCAEVTRAILERAKAGGRGARLSHRRHHPRVEGRGAGRVRRPAGGGLRRGLRRRPARGERADDAPRARVRARLRPHGHRPLRGADPGRGGRDERGPRLDDPRACGATRPSGEAIMVERDILLAELTRRQAPHRPPQRRRLRRRRAPRARPAASRVTAEATPHHLLLTDELVRESGYDTSTKMNPPLRAEADRRGRGRGPAGRHDRLHRHRPRAPLASTTRRWSSTRRRSGSSASRPRSRSASTASSPRASSTCRAWSRSSRRTRPASSACPAARSRPDPRRTSRSSTWTGASRSTRRASRPRGATRRSAAGRSRAGPSMTIVGGRIVWSA